MVSLSLHLHISTQHTHRDGTWNSSSSIYMKLIHGRSKKEEGKEQEKARGQTWFKSHSVHIWKYTYVINDIPFKTNCSLVIMSLWSFVNLENSSFWTNCYEEGLCFAENISHFFPGVSVVLVCINTLHHR